MAIKEYPRLCGGTFCTLILQALRQRIGAREHYKGDSDGLTDSEFLVGLIKVINPAYKNPGKAKLKTIANNYKACNQSNSVYFPFNDKQLISTFDEDVRKNYQVVLNRMIAFVDDFIDLTDTAHKDANLVRAVIDLIQQDESLPDDAEFYIGSNGEKIKKTAISSLKEVCLPSFLLGVWHYIVLNRKDNSVGKATYDIWCPSNGGGTREYIGDMGEKILPGLRVYHVSAQETVSSEIVEDYVEGEKTDEEAKDVPPSSSQQIVNNNPTFFNFNISGNNNNVFNHVDKLIIGNGGKRDE